jgi:hypothetical protein
MGDGNYRLIKEKNGNFDPEDVALANGRAYFSGLEKFKEYLDKVGDSEEVSCSMVLMIEQLINYIVRNPRVII